MNEIPQLFYDPVVIPSDSTMSLSLRFKSSSDEQSNEASQQTGPPQHSPLNQENQAVSSSWLSSERNPAETSAHQSLDQDYSTDTLRQDAYFRGPTLFPRCVPDSQNSFSFDHFTANDARPRGSYTNTLATTPMPLPSRMNEQPTTYSYQPAFSYSRHGEQGVLVPPNQLNFERTSPKQPITISDSEDDSPDEDEDEDECCEDDAEEGENVDTKYPPVYELAHLYADLLHMQQMIDHIKSEHWQNHLEECQNWEFDQITLVLFYLAYHVSEIIREDYEKKAAAGSLYDPPQRDLSGPETNMRGEVDVFDEFQATKILLRGAEACHEYLSSDDIQRTISTSHRHQQDFLSPCLLDQFLRFSANPFGRGVFLDREGDSHDEITKYYGRACLEVSEPGVPPGKSVSSLANYMLGLTKKLSKLAKGYKRKRAQEHDDSTIDSNNWQEAKRSATGHSPHYVRGRTGSNQGSTSHSGPSNSVSYVLAQNWNYCPADESAHYNMPLVSSTPHHFTWKDPMSIDERMALLGQQHYFRYYLMQDWPIPSNPFERSDKSHTISPRMHGTNKSSELPTVFLESMDCQTQLMLLEHQNVVHKFRVSLRTPSAVQQNAHSLYPGLHLQYTVQTSLPPITSFDFYNQYYEHPSDAFANAYTAPPDPHHQTVPGQITGFKGHMDQQYPHSTNSMNPPRGVYRGNQTVDPLLSQEFRAFATSFNSVPPPAPTPPPPSSNTPSVSDYQMQLMLLEQQNAKRLLMERIKPTSNAYDVCNMRMVGSCDPPAKPVQLPINVPLSDYDAIAAKVEQEHGLQPARMATDCDTAATPSSQTGISAAAEAKTAVAPCSESRPLPSTKVTPQLRDYEAQMKLLERQNALRRGMKPNESTGDNTATANRALLPRSTPSAKMKEGATAAASVSSSSRNRYLPMKVPENPDYEAQLRELERQNALRLLRKKKQDEDSNMTSSPSSSHPAAAGGASASASPATSSSQAQTVTSPGASSNKIQQPQPQRQQKQVPKQGPRAYPQTPIPLRSNIDMTSPEIVAQLKVLEQQCKARWHASRRTEYGKQGDNTTTGAGTAAATAASPVKKNSAHESAAVSTSSPDAASTSSSDDFVMVGGQERSSPSIDEDDDDMLIVQAHDYRSPT